MPAKPGETGLKVLLSSTLQPPVSLVQLSEVPPRGAELSDDSPGNRPVSKAGGTPCGTVGDVDLELVAVIHAWAELPESVKDAIRALVLRSLGEAE